MDAVTRAPPGTIYPLGIGHREQAAPTDVRRAAAVPVAVCVCTRNRPDDLARCLEALGASRVAPELVVVSDDGAGADAVAVPDGLHVRFVAGPGRGLASNRNNALRFVGSEYVLFLDDDCRIAPDYLEVALAAMAEAEARDGRGRVIVTGSESNDGRVVVAHDQDFLGFQRRPYGPGDVLRSIVINATLFPAALFRTEAFDDRLRYGYEEVDIASRAVARGHRIVSCPAARNVHAPSSRSREDYEAVLTTSRLYATFKRYWWTDGRRVRAVAFVVVASAHAVLHAARARDARGVGRATRSVWRAASFTRQHRLATRRP